MNIAESSRTGGIVVAYDGLATGGAAVDWAATEAERRGVPLTVMHVADYALLAGPFGTTPWEPALLRRAAEERTTEGVERARKTATTVPVTGSTAVSGVVYALTEASLTAELLVLGSHGHGSVGAALLGSVAYAVTNHADCPVVVVRGTRVEPCGPGTPVLVGVDGTEPAAVAVRFAADIAARADAPLVVLCAYPLDTSGNDWAKAAVRAAVDEVAKRHPHVSLQERIIRAAPAQALTEASHAAGLVVLGSRGRGAFSGLVLGSVGHRLVLAADCPVAVVR